VYKRARGSGFFLVMEQDGEDYYHLNFLARDKNEHSQLFFGEIKARLAPKEEHVTCCCPVSPSNVGTKHYCRQTVSASASPKCSTKHHCSFSNGCRIPCCKLSEGPRCAAFRGGPVLLHPLQFQPSRSTSPPSARPHALRRLLRPSSPVAPLPLPVSPARVLTVQNHVEVHRKRMSDLVPFSPRRVPRFVNPRIRSKPLRFSTLSSQTNLTLSVDCIQR
jgi:hypothetical protein